MHEAENRAVDAKPDAVGHPHNPQVVKLGAELQIHLQDRQATYQSSLTAGYINAFVSLNHQQTLPKVIIPAGPTAHLLLVDGVNASLVLRAVLGSAREPDKEVVSHLERWPRLGQTGDLQIYSLLVNRWSNEPWVAMHGSTCIPCGIPCISCQ